MSANHYLSLDDFRARALKGEKPEGAIRKSMPTTVESIEGTDRSLRFVISTAAVDRDNDTVAPTGWKLDNYKRNPVVLWAHDYSSLPVAKATGIGIEGGSLKADTQFADYPFAETVFRLLKGGFLNATSVGFAPKTYKINEERMGLDFEEQELLEFSIVPVPANPEALIEARAAGIDVAPMKGWAEGILKGLAKIDTKDAGEAVAQVVDELVPLGDAIDALEAAPVTEVAAAEAVAVEEVAAVEELAADAVEAAAEFDQAMTTVEQQVRDTKAAVEKRGRKLSAANEAKIRRAQQELSDVLAQLEQQSVEGEPEETPTEPAKETDKAKPMACGQCGVEADLTDGLCAECAKTKSADADVAVEIVEGELVLDLDALDPADFTAGTLPVLASAYRPDEIVLDIEEQEMVDLNPEVLREALREAVAAAVGSIVQREVATAINRARGRVD